MIRSVGSEQVQSKCTGCMQNNDYINVLTGSDTSCHRDHILQVYDVIIL